MGVKMTKPRHKPVEVEQDQVKRYESAGFKVAGGQDAAVQESESIELSDAEKQVEINAAGDIARKLAEEGGASEEEVEAAVQSARQASAESLDAS